MCFDSSWISKGQPPTILSCDVCEKLLATCDICSKTFPLKETVSDNNNTIKIEPNTLEKIDKGNSFVSNTIVDIKAAPNDDIL